mmetsp:Transcript_17734/g.54254  ORF Transcript_17734/g.54254 Transcript_17734/m.54254 type:complete len:252 (+) Transcript_17734:193-948(+)
MSVQCTALSAGLDSFPKPARKLLGLNALAISTSSGPQNSRKPSTTLSPGRTPSPGSTCSARTGPSTTLLNCAAKSSTTPLYTSKNSSAICGVRLSCFAAWIRNPAPVISPSTSPTSRDVATCGLTRQSVMSPSDRSVPRIGVALLKNRSTAALVLSGVSGTNHAPSSAPGSLVATSSQSSKVPHVSGPTTSMAQQGPLGAFGARPAAVPGLTSTLFRFTVMKPTASRPRSAPVMRSSPAKSRKPCARFGAR